MGEEILKISLGKYNIHNTSVCGKTLSPGQVLSRQVGNNSSLGAPAHSSTTHTRAGGFLCARHRACC